MTESSDSKRFWRKVWKTEGCWFWTASVDSHGYGQFRVGTRTIKAHRFAYEELIGPIPDGLEPDHLCRQHRCVNPTHLEMVTHRENILRGMAPSALHARKTKCPKGHPYDEANTRIDGRGSRQCRACKKARTVSLSKNVGQGHNNAVKTACPQGHPYSPENTYVLPSRPNARYCRACQKERTARRPPAS